MARRLLVGIVLAALIAVGSLAAPAQAVDFFLPDPTTSSVAAGNFYIYQLAVLAYFYDQQFGGGVGPGNPFYIESSPGQIKDLVVLGTGASGQPVNTNFSGMDNAYPTPSGVSGTLTFDTMASIEPGGGTADFVGDYTGGGGFAQGVGNTTQTGRSTWDVRIADLLTFLNGGIPVFFFNHNQENSGGASNQDLYGWAAIAAVDLQGVLPTKFFELTGENFSYPFPAGLTDVLGFVGNSQTTGIMGPGTDYQGYNPGGGFPTAPTSGSFILAQGQVCFNGTTFDPTCATGDQVINQNLGANQAAYAIVSPGLNGLLANNPGYDVLRFDIRLRNLTNGYEQIFMRALTVPQVPEPRTLVVLGVGLVGVALIAARRLRK